MPKLTRRSVLAALAPVVGAGAAAKLGGLSPGARAADGNGMDGRDGMAMGGRAAANGRAHGAFGFRRGAVVDHAANGFNPTEVLRDFDWGRTRRLPGGRVVREWQLIAQEKEIEVAPGVKFAAWTYNGRVPGPTLRCREGELLRIRLVNGSPTPHTIHFHGIHPAAMDGVPGVGAGVIEPGARTTYEFEARPFGLHLYHCHVNPLADHISKGLYGAFIVDPEHGRPEADEMVMVLNGFDTNFDRANEIYAANTVAFHYANEPIEVGCNELVRVYLANLLEFDLVNSLHLHGNLFDYYPTGTALRPSEYTDTIMQCQGQRGIVEIRFPSPGNFMFHAHQSEFTELGWMGLFNAGQGGGSRAAAARLCDLSGKDRT